MKLRSVSIACAFALAIPLSASADDVDLSKLFSGPSRIQQVDIANMSRDEIRLAGMRMFTKPFLKEDGFGDGNDLNPTGEQGQRGSLQGNGTFQRIGGLDAQSCLECHSIVSNRTVPMKFGIGGVGGVNSTVVGAGGNTFVDLDLAGRSGGDTQKNIDGRVINPPFIFGSGGVELVGNEMTVTLQEQIADAPANATTALTAKGISFGSITKDTTGDIIIDGDGNALGAEGTFDLRPDSNDFMVVAPFGRKGDNKTVRTFDAGAASFHFGMVVDEGIDHDLDGVVNEITEGEMSALSVFVATAQTPFIKHPKGEARNKARRGRQIMQDIGCTECHVPKMETTTRFLGFRSPEIAQDPSANIHTTVNLTKKPMHFKRNHQGGVSVPLFADLKRHYMGASLAEFDGDAMFTTARLWAVADTAPYLHDGRALTIADAIQEHGQPDSDAFNAVNNFNGLSQSDQAAVYAFLNTLRSPKGTFKKLNRLAKKIAKKQGHH